MLCSCAVLAMLQEVAQQLLPLVAPALLAAGGRYALVAHSMGCWAAYELLLLLQQAGESCSVLKRAYASHLYSVCAEAVAVWFMCSSCDSEGRCTAEGVGRQVAGKRAAQLTPCCCCCCCPLLFGSCPLRLSHVGSSKAWQL